MRNIVMALFAVIVSLSLQAATYTTVANGNFMSPAVWDCGCVPPAWNDIVINHRLTLSTSFVPRSIKINSGGVLTTTSGKLTIPVFMTIEAGAELKNNSMVIFKKDYTLRGLHSGLGEVRFDGTGTLWGSGSFTNNKGAKFNSGAFTIHSTANLDFSFRTTQLKNTTKVFNYGILTVGNIAASGATEFNNMTGATFNIKGTAGLSGNWKFHYAGNSVVYKKTGTSTQEILMPTVAYDMLVLEGSSTATVKYLSGQIQVNRELQIKNCMFDVRKLGVDYTVNIAGNWNNVSGRFLPRAGLVRFMGNGTIYRYTGLESFNSVTVSGDHSLISQILVAGQMTISNTLRTNGYTIRMSGNWNCIGTFAADNGQVIFESTSASVITGNTNFDDLAINKTGAGTATILSGQTGVYKTLSLNTGGLNTNGNLYIRSNATRTGRIGVVGAAFFNGDVTVERYMNMPVNNWHLIGSPIASSTLNQWKSDFVTTGFTGADFPTFWFNNMTLYDETVSGHKDLGVYNATNITNAIPNGVGCRAYIAGGITKLTTKGAPIMGPFSYSLSYTNTGSAQDDGWNLISNPYASTIDWDANTSWTKTNVKDAIYVWVAEEGIFTSYIAGLGTNGGSQYIPSSQAFWVQTDGASPGLSLVENAKSIVDETFRTYSNFDAFTIRMTGSGELKDEMAVRFHDEATMEFDGQLDAYEFKSTDPNMPSIGLRGADDILASIFSLAPIEESTSIPLEFHVGISGPVSFDVTGMVDCPWVNSVAIYDALSETTYNLRQGQSTSFDLEAGEYTDRFFLVLEPVYSENEFFHGPSNQASDLIPSASMFIQGDELVINAMDSENEMTDIIIHNIVGQVLVDLRQINLRNQRRIDIQGMNGILLIQMNQGDKLISVNKIIH